LSLYQLTGSARSGGKMSPYQLTGLPEVVERFHCFS
jgi:hypothetical protein